MLSVIPTDFPTRCISCASLYSRVAQKDESSYDHEHGVQQEGDQVRRFRHLFAGVPGQWREYGQP